jgi:hypothetical protein
MRQSTDLKNFRVGNVHDSITGDRPMSTPMRLWKKLLRIVPIVLTVSGCATGAHGLYPADLPAEMDLPKTGYPADFAQIRKNIAKTHGRGLLRSSSRESCPGCQRVTVEIQSIGTTADVNPRVALQRARVIGRIHNNGSDQEATYGLKPNTEYLIYLEPEPANAPGASIWLFELPTDANGIAYRIPLGDIQVCHAYFNPSPISDADFRSYDECDQPVTFRKFDVPQPAKPPGPSSSTHTEMDGRTLFLLMSGVWFECDAGCCVGSRAVY